MRQVFEVMCRPSRAASLARRCGVLKSLSCSDELIFRGKLEQVRRVDVFRRREFYVRYFNNLGGRHCAFFTAPIEGTTGAGSEPHSLSTARDAE
jgi:hypothetical protein